MSKNHINSIRSPPYLVHKTLHRHSPPIADRSPHRQEGSRSGAPTVQRILQTRKGRLGESDEREIEIDHAVPISFPVAC